MQGKGITDDELFKLLDIVSLTHILERAVAFCFLIEGEELCETYGNSGRMGRSVRMERCPFRRREATPW